MAASDPPRAPHRNGRWLAYIFLAVVALAAAVAIYGLVGPAPRTADGAGAAAPAAPDQRAPSQGSSGS